jgi:hypothetical protein
MSPTERIISVCLVIHILLLATTGIALRRDVGSTPVIGLAGVRSPVSLAVVPMHDAVVLTNRMLWSDLRIVTGLAIRYTHALGLAQYWGMFANSRHPKRYVKVAFELAPAHSTRAEPARSQVIEQIVAPTIRNDAQKPFLSEAFHRQRVIEMTMSDYWEGGSRPEGLSGLTRYLRTEFCRTSGTSCDRVIRTELWRGVTADANGAMSDDADAPNPARELLLAQYFDGPKLQFRSETPRVGYSLAESGLLWTLRYVDPPESDQRTEPLSMQDGRR